MGLEPIYLTRQANILPLNYTPKFLAKPRIELSLPDYEPSVRPLHYFAAKG